MFCNFTNAQKLRRLLIISQGALCPCKDARMSFSDFANKWSAGLTRHIPPGQFGRYLLVGTWNTLFGYGTFALFTAVLNPFVPHSYILASLLSSLLNITVAYLGYKWFVFKTRGHYLREWMRR